MKKNNYDIIQDLGIIALSIVIALLLVETNIINKLLSSTEYSLLASFIAGTFFTSIFTTAPAIAALAEIAQSSSLIGVAIAGAIGAVLGDLIIFSFIKDRFSTHLMEIVSHSDRGKRMASILKKRAFRWITFIVGGMIIASPLPDELGIGLLGLSKLQTWRFLIVSFVFNFIGIMIIGLVAQKI